MATGVYELFDYDRETPDEAPRIDLRDKVSGRATYVEDIPQLPGTMYGAALRSPYAHARIVRIDSTAARALPGVLGIVDRDHLDEFGVRSLPPPVLDPVFVCTDKVRFEGDLVAFVVADDYRTAREAVELIEVDWEPLRPVFTVADALAADAPLIHEELDTNEAFDERIEWGDVEQGLRDSARVFDYTFEAPTVFHHPMEPTGTGLVRWDGDVAEVWAPTNTPVRDAEGVAKALGIPT